MTVRPVVVGGELTFERARGSEVRRASAVRPGRNAMAERMQIVRVNRSDRRPLRGADQDAVGVALRAVRLGAAPNIRRYSRLNCDGLE